MTTPRGTDTGAPAEVDPQEGGDPLAARTPSASATPVADPSVGQSSTGQPSVERSAGQPPGPQSAAPAPPGPIGTGDRAVSDHGTDPQVSREPEAAVARGGGLRPGILEAPRPGAGERAPESGSAATSPTTVLPVVAASPRVPPPTPPAAPAVPGVPRRLAPPAGAPPRSVSRGEGRPTSATRPAARPRRARLTLKRIDPWSVFVLSLVGSVFLGIALVVAAAALYAVIDSLGVTESLNQLFAEVTGTTAAIEPLLTAGRVVGTAAVLAAANVVLLTLLATLGALLYNLCASFTGGLELTFGERD
ncbi:MAG: DUF3566 domain-containing protein [Mycobacteriales bacterium]